jgi:hypothetical protein
MARQYRFHHSATHIVPFEAAYVMATFGIGHHTVVTLNVFRLCCCCDRRCSLRQANQGTGEQQGGDTAFGETHDKGTRSERNGHLATPIKNARLAGGFMDVRISIHFAVWKSTETGVLPICTDIAKWLGRFCALRTQAKNEVQTLAVGTSTVRRRHGIGDFLRVGRIYLLQLPKQQI